MRITVSWGLLGTVYWSRDVDGTGWSKFLLESALECQYVVRDTTAEKELDIAI